jgi:hypothetical protein
MWTQLTLGGVRGLKQLVVPSRETALVRHTVWNKGRSLRKGERLIGQMK